MLSIPLNKLPWQKEHFLKLLILGDLGVGKTSLVKKYCSSDSGPEYKVSVDVTHRWHLCAQVMSWLEFQLKGNPWLFVVLKANIIQKSFDLYIHLSTFLVLKGYYILIRDWNSSQLNTWAHKCHYSCKSVNVNGLKINLQLWDIPGHERFGGMTRVHYKVVLCIFWQLLY